ERVKAQLKARLGQEVYSSWFGRMKLAEASKGIVRLSVPTAFLRSWINGHYVDLINDIWKQDDPSLLKLEIVVRSTTRPGRPSSDDESTPARRAARAAATPAATPAPKLERQSARPIEADARGNLSGSPIDARYT